MIETERLILRRWEDRDRAPFAEMMTDPRVADWLGGVRTRLESDATIDRWLGHIDEHGYGFWAVERKADRRLLGMTGLRFYDWAPGPGVEAGWRLAADAWGQGFATEAATAALAWGFANLDEPEIVAWTAERNLRSQAVMHRIGMVRAPDRDFDNPQLPADHPLLRHLVFTKVRP